MSFVLEYNWKPYLLKCQHVTAISFATSVCDFISSTQLKDKYLSYLVLYVCYLHPCNSAEEQLLYFK